tara:strand:- start:469 stop:714 length:246 start_codon:yes stop_codon:yes gene_type:complete
MSSNWFYISQWKKKRLSYIGVEMSYKEAEDLYKSMLGYDDIYLALINKDNKWKVVISKEDINSWNVVKLNKSEVQNERVIS